MSFHLRSINERLLARHRLKRSPPPAETLPQSLNPNAADNVLSIPPSFQTDPPPVPTDVAPLTMIGAQITTFKPVVSILPPVDPGKHPASTTSPAASTTTIFVTSVSPIVSATPSSSASTPITPTNIPPSSSLTVSPTANNHVSATPSRPASSVASGNASPPSSRSSHGLSGGAVGALVTIVIILAAAVIAFFVRKQHQRRRAIKRNTWGAGLIPSLENKRDTIYANQPMGGQSHRLPNVPLTSEVSQAPATHSLSGIPPPVSSYNPALPPSFPAPSLRGSVAPSVSSMRSAPPAEIAIVARTFIPSLPDELHIANGEQIQIISAYDDGWALCSNLRGEQGVVPLECLERITGVPAPTEMQLQPQGHDSNRTSRRMSSLTPNAAGTY